MARNSLIRPHPFDERSSTDQLKLLREEATEFDREQILQPLDRDHRKIKCGSSD